jgi:hypothetical protein
LFAVVDEPSTLSAPIDVAVTVIPPEVYDAEIPSISTSAVVLSLPFSIVS